MAISALNFLFSPMVHLGTLWFLYPYHVVAFLLGLDSYYIDTNALPILII